MQQVLAQSTPPANDTAAADRPLPDVAALMHAVEQHQRDSEAIQKYYLYHEDARREDVNGKQIEQREFDVFWQNGVQLHKMTRKDGRDLTSDEQKKEDERLSKEIEKAKERKRKAAEKSQPTDSRGHEEITVSRFLSLGSFTNPRRVQINGRDTIAVDYTGNPKAKTQNRFEDVVRNLMGTIWVDEQDRAIVQLEGRLTNSYKIGGGLMMNIKKDTSFSVRQKKVNDEVWLPAQVTGEGSARVLLFINFNGRVHVTDSDYRKFRTSATILPGITTVEGSSAGEGTPTEPGAETPAVRPEQ